MAKQPLPTYSICSIADTPVTKNDFMTDRFSHYLEAHKDLHFPHKHSFYHLVFFTEGSGSHSIDFINFPVEPGQIYFMTPGQVHEWNFKKTPEGYIINFSENYINTLLMNARYLDQFLFFSGNAIEQVIKIPKQERPQLVQLLEKILREEAAGADLKDDMIRTAMIQLFIHVNRLATPAEKIPVANYNSVLLKNFQKLIDLHYREKKLTRDYAAMLFVTPNHLNALSKHVTGKPAGELIRDRVVLEAKRLLVNEDMSIAEVASELEFEDNSYFSKFFRKYTGQTPEAFRKSILDK
ncbi:AraC family transcriptional regulator [Pseudoflavitalea rhizosphaerae]|uniref:AraC family transcriptional regulator n=1 Tax=Pseudoflavitalea rhizosphaerae TaxID=1884793 RepID=UPI000F8E3D62|nr:helix-turn-helix transcriptional regulator [Pseudoflavitalea rhizosphaerae]